MGAWQACWCLRVLGGHSGLRHGWLRVGEWCTDSPGAIAIAFFFFYAVAIVLGISLASSFWAKRRLGSVDRTTVLYSSKNESFSTIHF